MTDTVATPAVATPTAKTRKKASSFDPNPAKAGWATKLVLLFLCIAWMIPIIGMLVTSFRPFREAESSGWWTVFTNPSTMDFTFENYQEAWTGADMGNAFVNSLAIVLPATFIPILVAAFAAYAFTFMEFPGRDFLFLAIVSLLVVPNYVAFVPMLKIYGNLGINGTFASVWLAHIGFGMSLAIYILRNYMATLPKTVIESAKIDGASHFQTFYRLVLPMSVPALAAFAIFQFLWVWNDLLVALVFIGPGQNEPLTVALTRSAGPARPGLEPHHGRRLHLDDRADRRVPRPAAVLRPRPDRGSRQGLTTSTRLLGPVPSGAGPSARLAAGQRRRRKPRGWPGIGLRVTVTPDISATPLTRTTGESGVRAGATLSRPWSKAPMIPTPSTMTWVYSLTTTSIPAQNALA